MIVPWRDRHGRFLPLKAVVLAAGFIPGAVLAFWWANGMLGGRPVTEVIHGTGDWAIRYLLISLAITPAARVLNWPRLLLVRRIVGLTALAYALAHLTLFVVDQNFHLVVAATEILRRFYLTIGFVVLLGLGILGCHIDQWLGAAARAVVEAAAPGDLRARRDRAAALLHPVEGERVGTGVLLRPVRLAADVARAADGLAAQPDRAAGAGCGGARSRPPGSSSPGMRWQPGSTPGASWRRARRCASACVPRITSRWPGWRWWCWRGCGASRACRACVRGWRLEVWPHTPRI